MSTSRRNHHATLDKIRRYSPIGLSYVLGLEKVPVPPIQFHIEITNICNFRCLYCPQSRPKDHFRLIGPGKMDFDTFRRIIDRLSAEYHIDQLVLTRDGEPLVHPQLEDFVRYAFWRGIRVEIGSNGSLISRQRARRLMESGLASLTGDFCHDRKTYEELRAGSRYERSLSGYRNILEEARRMNADFVMELSDLHTCQLVSEVEIEQSLEKLASLFVGYDRWLHVRPAAMHNALGQAALDLSTGRGKNERRYNRCHHPWLAMVVDYHGNVVGCCRDLRSEYQVGNVLEAADIDRDVWNGERMQFLRNRLRRKLPEEIEICHHCDLPYGESYVGKTIIGKIVKVLF